MASIVTSSHLFWNVGAILYMVDSPLLSQVVTKVAVPSACRLFRRGHPCEVQPVIILLRLLCVLMRKGNAYVREYLCWKFAV